MANLKDFATGTVSVAPTPALSGNSLTLQSGEGAYFPTPPFYANAHPDYQLPTLANTEKILVTAIVGDVLTFQRAQGSGTTAKSIAVGWRISNAVYKDDLFNSTIIQNEVPAGALNGSNMAYTVAAAFTPGTLAVYLNGQRLRSGAGNDYTENSSLRGFTMNYAPASDDVLSVDYIVGTSVMMQGVNVFINQETPTGAVNGTNAAYTTSKGYVSGTLEVYINGILQAPGTHVTEVSSTAGTFTVDTPPQTNDIVRVSYQYAVSAGGNAASVQGYSANDLTPIGVMQPYAGRRAPNSWLLAYGQAVSRVTYLQLFQTLNPFVGNFTITIAAPGVITLNNHEFQTGDSLFLTTSGALPTGLAANTLYYAIRVDANTIRLATSYANAIAGTAITTTGTQSGTHSLYASPYGLGDGSTTFNVPDARGRVIAGLDIMGGTSADRLTAPSTTGSINGDVLGAAGGEQAHTQTTSELVSHDHSTPWAIGFPNGTSAFAINDNGGDRIIVADNFGAGQGTQYGDTRTMVNNEGSSTPANVVQPTLIANVIIKAL